MHPFLRSCLAALACAWATFATLGSIARAQTIETRYYMVVLGYEGPRNDPRDSHTFATFIRASGPAPFAADTDLESHTISWIPADIGGGDVICIIGICSTVTGKNYSLVETMILGTSSGRTVKWSGPYEVTKDLFDLAIKRIEYLSSGKARYVAKDSGKRGAATWNGPGGITNCFHAVSDIGGDLSQGLDWGHSTISKVVRHLRPYVIRDASADQAWIAARLGLEGY